MATADKTGQGGTERREEVLEQDQAQRRQQDRLEQERRLPDANEEQVRRRQGGHDRPVENDHRPHRRSEAEPGDE